MPLWSIQGLPNNSCAFQNSVRGRFGVLDCAAGQYEWRACQRSYFRYRHAPFRLWHLVEPIE